MVQFQVRTAEEFSRAVAAFDEWEEMRFPAGLVERVKKAERVFTATEGPLDQPLSFHHEHELNKEFPSKIFFFCLEPSPEGGQTSVVPSHVVLKKKEKKLPQFVEKCEEVGVVHRVRIPRFVGSDYPVVLSKTWQWILEADDEVEAQRRDIPSHDIVLRNFIKFTSDTMAQFSHGVMNPIRDHGGRRVWFNAISSYTSNEKDGDIAFGDGNRRPPGTQEIYKSILEGNCVDDIEWQKCDVLLVDNLSVQHARRPGKASEDYIGVHMQVEM